MNGGEQNEGRERDTVIGPGEKSGELDRRESDEWKARARVRNWLTLGAIAAVCVLFYVITILRMSGE